MTIEKENIKKRKAPTDVYKEINMKYLIDNGEISINDRIYITVKPEEAHIDMDGVSRLQSLKIFLSVQASLTVAI